MIICNTVAQIQTYRQSVAGQSIGFVPTMGALHAGHMRLIETARAACDVVIASIFVNPLQFGANEDLSRYPRPLEQDTSMLRDAGVDALFLPTPAILYPDNFCTMVTVDKKLTGLWCGAARPGHFDGVATVVAKLFHIVAPTQAFFGEKDFQQLTIIRRMVSDLNMPVKIQAVPVVRNADGLALSSRNQYLTTEQQQQAAALYKTLCWVRDTVQSDDNTQAVLAEGIVRLQAAGFSAVDYLALVDSDTLLPIMSDHSLTNTRLLVAAHLHGVRLIDTIAVA